MVLAAGERRGARMCGYGVLGSGGDCFNSGLAF